MSVDEQRIWFNIDATPGLGPAAAQKIARYLDGHHLGADAVPDMDQLVLETELGLSAGVAAALVRQLAHPETLPGVRDGAEFLTPGDPHFPRRRFLRANPPLPPILYAVGEASLLTNEGRWLAVAGSRETTDEILDTVRTIARTGSDDGWMVVSGLARGVDSAAHEGAMRGRTGTIGVLASGVSNTGGAWLPDDGEGICMVSQFAPEDPWSGPRAMQRNPTIAGLADRVFVAAAGTSGGSWEMAQLCLRRDKPLFVLDLPPEVAPGNQALIRSGAIAVDPSRPEDTLADQETGAPTLFD